MTKSFYVKLSISLLILLLSLYFLYPTGRLSMLDEEGKKALSMQELENLENRSINLGLDLRGGMYLVLEVDMDKVKEEDRTDALDRALEVIRNRVDQFGVAEPVIQKQGEKRIVVQLPGLQDPQRAKNLIGQTALLEFKIVREGEDARSILATIDQIAAKGDLLQKYNITSVEPKSDSVPKQSEGSILDQLTASSDSSQADSASTDTTAAATENADLLPNQTGAQPLMSRIIIRPSEKFTNFFVLDVEYSIVDSLLKTPEAQAVIPEDASIVWANEKIPMGDGKIYRQLFVIFKKAEMTGAAVKDARATIGQGYDPSTANRPIVNFEVKGEAVDLFSQITGANLNKRLAIVLDNRVVSAPELIVRIRDGRSIITGSQSMDEAKDLSIVLRSGALPAPVNVIEERTVGPTLGSDSIQAGKFAAIIGLILVAFFMMIYYKLSGGISVVALVLNMIFIMAAMAYLHATLTLPGIAGLVLTIGMSVDANVLIFERIREEMLAGKTSIVSVENGFGKAFWTIFDANITTLITALVLYVYGTGPIRGFAVTLSLGILSSLFTALVVSRILFDYLVYKVRIKSLSI